jgi:hypothetical protein
LQRGGLTYLQRLLAAVKSLAFPSESQAQFFYSITVASATSSIFGFIELHEVVRVIDLMDDAAFRRAGLHKSSY